MPIICPTMTAGHAFPSGCPQEMMNEVDHVDMSQLDEMSRRLRQQALEAMEDEPQLTMLLKNTVLAPGVVTFEDAVATTITYRLLLKPCHASAMSLTSSHASAGLAMFCPFSLRTILLDALQSQEILEAGHTMAQAVRLDAQAVVDRDPAVGSLLEVVLFLKGFAALVSHRAAFYKWHSNPGKRNKRSLVSLWLQSQASAMFGVDIHPAAVMGAGILLDHGTGIVIGETAAVGDGCTLLHGVTLGGTGKDKGDRHPKVGKDVLIGAGASLLGNIPIGDGAKIGAGSIVLGPIPSGATAVGAPAKIVGRAREPKPGSTVDETLQQVSYLHKSESSTTVSTASVNSISLSTGWEEVGSAGMLIDKEAKEIGKEPETKDIPKAIERRDSGSSDGTNCCCPFRDYRRMAESAPPGSITLVTLIKLLKPEGCEKCAIGEVLFALDTRDVGYVKPRAFFTKETANVIAAKTNLSPERVGTVLADFYHHWQARTKESWQGIEASKTKARSQSINA